MTKHAIALCLFSSTLTLLTPSAFAQHKRHGHRPTTLEHAKPIAAALLVGADAKKPAEPEAAPSPSKSSFWMAATPHVPLAVTSGKEIHGVGKRGKDCGSANRWAKPKSRWHAIDAHGAITGTFEVKDAELYDVTNCREVSFAKVKGEPGVGLFVSEDSGYKPDASMAFTPSAAEKKKFERFLNAVEATWVDHKPLGKYVPWGKRTQFFHFAPPKDPNFVARLDGAGKPIVRPTRWAVSGGPVLTVAYLGQNGQWHASTIKPPMGLADSYVPVAVFDMNGDGVPEIVYRSSDGPSFADAVMTLDPATMRWNDAAESPGGAML